MNVIIERLDPSVELPKRATAQSAGFDLKAAFLGRDVTVYTPHNQLQMRQVDWFGTKRGIKIYPGERALVPTGFKATLPDGYQAEIRPRSGLALKQALAPVNSPGTIDADFPGEWAVLLENRSGAIATVLDGQAIGQAVITTYEAATFEDGTVGQTTERVGGFGSTDVATVAPTTAATAPVETTPTESVEKPKAKVKSAEAEG